MKKIKTWFYLYNEDILKTIQNIILVIVVFAFFVYAPKIIRHYFINRLDSEEIGIIDKIEGKKGIYEAREGAKVVLKSYQINYHFTVNQQVIQSSEILGRNALEYKKWHKISKLKTGDTIIVKYDSEQITKSRIEIQ